MSWKKKCVQPCILFLCIYSSNWKRYFFEIPIEFFKKNNTYRWLFIYQCHHICLKQIQMGDLSLIFLPNWLGVNTTVSLLSNVDIPLFVSCTVQKTLYSAKFSKISVNKYEKSCFYHMVQCLFNILHVRFTITTLKDKLKKIKSIL